jgi:hypothetical protein
MTRSSIDLAECRYEVPSHHPGRLRAWHRGANQAERTVTGRSTSIPVFGVLALLLATAALPYIHPASNTGTIEPRGTLGEAERATVELFERVSPSAATTTKPVPPRRDAEPSLGGPEFLRIPDLLVFAKQAGGASALLKLGDRDSTTGEGAFQKRLHRGAWGFSVWRSWR